MTTPQPRSLRTLAGAWIALLLLLALTCGSAFVPMGPWNLVANFAIATMKAAIVLVLFMELRQSAMIVRVVALAGIVFLLVLTGLSMTDLAVRGY